MSDTESFLFSLDNLTTYKNSSNSVMIAKHRGPAFGGTSLVLGSSDEMMNKEGEGLADSNGYRDYFQVPCETDGASSLTGSKDKDSRGMKRFTL
jgi:hypothetical protein